MHDAVEHQSIPTVLTAHVVANLLAPNFQDIPVRTCGEQCSSRENLDEMKLFRPRVSRGKILGE